MRLNITQKKRRKKMENKINIAEILRDCPEGTKLYSPVCGACTFLRVANSAYYPIMVKRVSDTTLREDFTKDGRYAEGVEDGECVLFPSAEMRDWDKFFKRGDVVYNPNSGMLAIFEGWVNNDYTEFNTTLNYYNDHTFGEEEVCATDCFVKATDKQRVVFIEAAEKHYGGKYNPETLQVEPVKVVESKCSFKPFQKVLVRDEEDEDWKADYFSHYEEDDKIAPYVCVGSYYRFCIPYEGSEHLLGTGKPF